MVFLIDCDIPWVPLSVKPPEDTKIVQLDVDPLKLTFPLWGFPADLRVAADSSAALSSLNSIIQKILTRKLSRNDIRNFKKSMKKTEPLG